MNLFLLRREQKSFDQNALEKLCIDAYITKLIFWLYLFPSSISSDLDDESQSASPLYILNHFYNMQYYQSCGNYF